MQSHQGRGRVTNIKKLFMSLENPNNKVSPRIEEESKESIYASEKECAQFLEGLHTIAIDDSIFDKDIEDGIKQGVNKRWMTVSFLYGSVYPSEVGHWKVLHRGGEDTPFSIYDLQHEMFRLSGRIADQNEKDSFEQSPREQIYKLSNTIDADFLSKKDLIYRSVDTALSLEGINPSLTDYEKYLEILEKALDTYKHEQVILSDRVKSSSHDSRYPMMGRYKVFHDVLPSVITMVKQRLAETRSTYSSMKTEMKREKVRVEKDEKEKEQLLKKVEKQISYLKRIYDKGTGLQLPDTESIANRVIGSNIGSVSTGRSMKLSLDLRQSLVILDEDHISLEMGDDLESIKKRLAMVNWIVPHEIAHLVDQESDVSDRLFSEEEVAPVNAVTENWKGDNQELAQEIMLSSIIKETIIDAIGYRMLKEYGTANPLDKTKAERITAALGGYVSTVNAVEQMLETYAEEDDMRSRYSLFILRKIAGGEILVTEARENDVNDEVIKEAKEGIEKLRKTFQEFNQETHFVEESQGNEIIEMCRHFFKKAEQVPLMKRVTKK